MRLKHHDCDSQVVDSTRHCQFGTRGSEVQILSPRPLKSITYISITYIRFSEVKIAWGSQKGSQSLPVPPSDSTFGETSIFSLSFLVFCGKDRFDNSAHRLGAFAPPGAAE